MKTDTEILDWMESNPRESFTKKELGYWRRTFGYKDARNQFSSLREAVSFAMDDPKNEGKPLEKQLGDSN